MVKILLLIYGYIQLPTHTHLSTFVLDVARGYGLPRDEEVGIDVLDEPVKGFALESAPQGFSLADVAKVSQVVVKPLVVVVLELVHPHFR